MKKRLVSMMMLLLVIVVATIGCSQKPAEPANNSSASTSTNSSNLQKNEDTTNASTGEKVTLSVFSTISQNAVQDVMHAIAAEFTSENPNINVQFDFPGGEYENLLKVRMSASNLPDVFDTHGWAKIRYGSYLADLRDEEWTANLTDTIRPVVTDDEGKVHALVLSEAKDGIAYNVDILEQYNIPVPTTIDELMAAAEKIKTESNGTIAPFFMSGIDSNMIAVFIDHFATSYFISPENNDAQALLDGEFDWNKWTPLAQRLLDLKEKGYLIDDVLTARRSDLPQRFAEGKVAFVSGLPSFADDVYAINPEVKIGLFPVPSVVEGDTPTFSGGERYTMGAWKDGQHLEESKKLIAFFARSENMAKINNATKMPPGLKNVETNHEFAEFYNRYNDIRVYPYFDRVYLPNGMWGVMTSTGTELLAGIMTPEEVSEKMKQEVERLSSN